MEANKGGENVPSSQAYQGGALNEDPGAGVREDASEGAQEDPQSPSRVLPNKEAPLQRAPPMVIARSRYSQEQMATSGDSKKAPGQGWDTANTTEEE